MPVGKCVKVGVWENGKFIGCVLFAQGNTPTLGTAYGLKMVECCELVRIALTAHSAAVSRIVSIALRMLKKVCPGVRLVVSFADPTHGHHGGIYQAGGWVFCGESTPSLQWFHEGRWKHNREVTSGAFGNKRKITNLAELPKRLPLGKLRYLMPLDAEMKARIEPLRKPYPKRAESVGNCTSVNHTEREGVTPISALHSLTES